VKSLRGSDFSGAIFSMANRVGRYE